MFVGVVELILLSYSNVTRLQAATTIVIDLFTVYPAIHNQQVFCPSYSIAVGT